MDQTVVVMICTSPSGEILSVGLYESAEKARAAESGGIVSIWAPRMNGSVRESQEVRAGPLRLS